MRDLGGGGARAPLPGRGACPWLRILRRLEYTNEDNVIQTKGRTACEVNTADELLLTELIFNGIFNEMTSEQIVPRPRGPGGRRRHGFGHPSFKVCQNKVVPRNKVPWIFFWD